MKFALALPLAFFLAVEGLLHQTPDAMDLAALFLVGTIIWRELRRSNLSN